MDPYPPPIGLLSLLFVVVGSQYKTTLPRHLVVLLYSEHANNPTHKREADLFHLISPLLHCGSPLALNSSDDDDL